MRAVTPETEEEEMGTPFEQGEPLAVYLRTPCKFGWSKEYDCIKGTVESVDGHGILVLTPYFDGVFIPWGNVAVVREIKEEDLKT